MNLVEKLIQADTKAVEAFEEKEWVSKRLSKIIGEDQVKIKLRELPPRKVNDIVTMGTDRKGKLVDDKLYEAQLLCCVEGIVDPPLKDPALKEKFLPKGGTPKQLAEKLFRNEVREISEKILDISGVGSFEEDEKEKSEIKN